LVHSGVPQNILQFDISFVFLKAVSSLTHKANSSKKLTFLRHHVQKLGQQSHAISHSHQSFFEALINFSIRSFGFIHHGSLENMYLNLSKELSMFHCSSTYHSLYDHINELHHLNKNPQTSIHNTSHENHISLLLSTQTSIHLSIASVTWIIKSS